MTLTSIVHKPATQRRGLMAETIAAWLLRAKGYTVLQRRSRHHLGEADIVARDGCTLVVVEVKYRASQDKALHALHPNQLARLTRRMQQFSKKSAYTRVDALFVYPRWPFVCHVKNISIARPSLPDV